MILLRSQVPHNSRMQRTVHALRASPAADPPIRYTDDVLYEGPP